MKKIITTIAISLLLSSCSNNNEEVTTKAEFTVFVTNDAIENLYPNSTIANASVLVYETIDDLKNNQNLFASGSTNENGELIFSENVEFNKSYYLEVFKSCSSNYFSISINDEANYKVTPVKSSDGEINYFNINLNETGAVQINNNITDDLIIKIHNVEYGKILVNGSTTFDYFPTSNIFYNSFELINEATLENYSNDEIKAFCGEIREYNIN